MAALGTEPKRRQDVEMWRGDTVTMTVAHTFGAASNVSEAKFYVRKSPDGEIIVALTKTVHSGQWSLTSNQAIITINPSDTAGKSYGTWVYDVELTHTNGTVQTFQEGRFVLHGDMSHSGGGGAVAGYSDEQLKQWVYAEAWSFSSITYHSTYPYVIASGNVKWPDGSAGVFTATTTNTTWSAVDAFTITHADRGKTITQTAVTRNDYGAITTRPDVTIA